LVLKIDYLFVFVGTNSDEKITIKIKTMPHFAMLSFFDSKAIKNKIVQIDVLIVSEFFCVFKDTID